jgi:TonB family protein
MQQLLADGYNMTAVQAQQIEQQLTRDPENLVARAKLIAYYFMNAMPHLRLEHIFWFFEHHPESELALSEAARINPGNGLLNSQSDYDRAKALWLDQAARHPKDTAVLANAAKFLQDADQPAAADLIKRARQIEPSNPQWTRRLAFLYMLAVQHSTPPPPGISVGPNADPAFVAAVRKELETSTDALLVGAVGEDLVRSPQEPVAPPGALGDWLRQEAKARREYAELLLHRAQSLDPGNAEWLVALATSHAPSNAVGVPPQTPPGGSVKRIRVGARVQQENLLHSVDPVYPPLARQARIQGVVRFNVIIGKDGHVENATLMSGHPLLVPAAQEALKQWIYRPTLLNGDPVEVATVVDVPFTLPHEMFPPD